MSEFMPLSPGDSFQTFMSRSMDLDPNTFDQEQEWIENWRTKKCKKSYDRLYMSNVRLVSHLRKLYSDARVCKEELMQEGLVGLAQAIEQYDPSHGVPFGTYASRWIKAAMRQHIMGSQDLVRIATGKTQRKLYFKLRPHHWPGKRLKGDELRRVADLCGASESEVLDMQDRLDVVCAPLLQDDSDHEVEGKGTYRESQMASSDPGPEARILDYLESEKRSRRFQKRMYKLSKSERELIARRYLIDDKDDRPTHADLRELFGGVSRERVRQIEAKTLKRMQSLFKRELTLLDS